MLRTHTLRVCTLLALWALAGAALAEPVTATLYHDPNCGCCTKYVEHLRAAGYAVEVETIDDRTALFREAGVPPELSSCHMMRIGGYVVVGHVPLAAIEKLLTEQPDIAGISLPGMPIGTPGMPGPKTEPYVVRSLDGEVYARY